MVPAVLNLVSTSGSFKREMNFEIKPNETLQELVSMYFPNRPSQVSHLNMKTKTSKKLYFGEQGL